VVLTGDMFIQKNFCAALVGIFSKQLKLAIINSIFSDPGNIDNFIL